MKKYTIPEIKVVSFITNESMTDPYATGDPLSVINIFGLTEQQKQVGSINFETLK